MSNLANATLEQVVQAEIRLKYLEHLDEPEDEEEKKNLSANIANTIAQKLKNEEFLAYLDTCE